MDPYMERMLSLFPQMEDPEKLSPAFFRDHVYQASETSGIKVPWDISAPQPALAPVSHLFHGRVLDVGCGLGENSLWLASLPSVTHVAGVDIAEPAIARAKDLQGKAGEIAAKLEFLQADVFNLPFPASEQFDALLDSAVFHCIGDDEAQGRYLAAVTPHIKLGGTAVMLVMSDANPDPWVGPRRVSKAHATRMWSAAGWRVDCIDDARFQSCLHTSGNNLAILMQATRVT